jgi:hypothetical protein
MTDTLEKLIRSVDQKVCMIFDATGVVYPMWHCVLPNGDIHVLVPPFDDKDATARVMRAYFKMTGITSFCFVDEAWTVVLPVSREGEIPELMRRGVSKHPERCEVLAYIAEYESGSTSGHRPILRAPGSKPKLGPLEIFPRPPRSEGRLVGMLPQRGTMQ